MNSSLSKAQGTVTGFGGVANTALLGVGASLAVVGIAAVKAASDLGESLNKAKVVFGDASGAVEAFSETSAESFGISQAAALEAAAGFGAMAQSAGLSEKASADMSITLVKLAADMASFNNQDPSEMLERLRSGLAGEAEPLRKFGVFISEARVQTEAYASGIAKAGEELTDAQKVQARFNIILQDTTKAQGDFGRTIGESLPNQIRKLKAEFTDLLAQIGAALLPSLVEAAEALVGVVEAMGPLLDLVGKLGPAVHILGEAFTVMLSPLAKFLDLMGNFEPTEEMVAVMGSAVVEMQSMEAKAALAEAGIRNLTGGVVEATEGQRSLGEETARTTEEIREQRLAILAATNSFLGIQLAADGVAEAQREVNRLERQGKEDTKAYDDAVIDLLGNQIALEEAVFSFGQELVESGKKTSDVVGKIKEMGREFGLSQGEVQELIDRIKEYIRQINNIPKEQTTTVTTIFRQQGDFPSRAGPAPGLQHGGIVERTGLAVVHKGEVFSGVNNEMGFGGVNITVNGWVGNDQALARKIRDELNKLGNRNAGTGIR